MVKRTSRSDRRLADMAASAELELYKPPPESAGDVYETTVPLGPDPGDYLVVRQHVYRGKVVDFAIMQYHDDEESGRCEVARIDCCHGHVHRHMFARGGREKQRSIQVIPAEDGQNVVNRLYGECYQRMMDEYEANVRRWGRT